MRPKLSNSVEAAQALLGWELIHYTPYGPVGGIIIETEAYASNDPASHSFKGVTSRTQPMFLEAGTVYMYFIYGMHWCFNIVTGPVGTGEAVLIRALKPTIGQDIMHKNRHTQAVSKLCNGPGSLVQALGIPPLYNGRKLSDTHLELRPPAEKLPLVQASTRIGITKAKEKLWRFFITA